MNERVSFVLPSLNEEKNIVRCLNSIGKQTYPHDRIEIIVSDAHSTDRTREVVDAWAGEHDIEVRIVDNDRIITEFGNAVALKQARGDLIWIMGCDAEIVEEGCLEAYVKAFDVFPDIVGVERKKYKIPGGSLINNYITVADWGDPLAREIGREPTLLEVRQVDGRTYRRLRFYPEFPKLLLYKRSAIARYIDAEQFTEGLVMLDLAKRGENIMARVDGYGYRHHHATSFAAFLRKRAKIARKHMTRVQTEASWVNHSGGKRLYWAAFLHLTVVYPLVYSLIRAVREREPLWLLHAPLCFSGAAAYAVNWLYIKITRRKAW
ncbi:MAG: glycosyltransferase family 2 protein [Lentisphaerae bacterium]|nr:glycosyltransferase family 2 protein [Lentisphaerota bacterium]